MLLVFSSFQQDMKDSISQFMSNVHKSVNEMSLQYLRNDRRYNYTTPKSFLEQIKLYQNLLGNKHSELLQKMLRLENGLEKLKSTAQQVEFFCSERKVNPHHSSISWGLHQITELR